MIKTASYAGYDAVTNLKFYTFDRREVRDLDVLVEIKYCGVCHTDIHIVRNEWGNAQYPLVPGHEIVGIVKKVGAKVQKFKEGDIVGVGYVIDSCGHCECCQNNQEQFCQKGCTFAYNSVEADGNITKGGYSDNIVVNEKFVLKIPANLKLENVAPLLCAGVTTYSPLKHWKIGKNHKVGIIGLGGLGHMAVKFACSMGAHVVVFTTTPHKKEDALKMGAHEVVISKDPDEMNKHTGSFNFMLDTISGQHDMASYLAMLKVDGTLCMLGVSTEPHLVPSGALILGRKSLSGSLTGGIAETQEMLEYCAQHNITCDIELIPIQKINEAYQRVLKSDVKYRFVIDMQSLKRSVQI
ncbi:MAG: hypothetical protein RJA83_269 [Pseudomonadota bacterium]|jgi:uncharacterized zinc-type alcohol dehydrogenase-like protein